MPLYPPYLTSHNLTASYGGQTLFRDLSLTLHPGERYGIVGPNGAGKSTLFKIIKGVLSPASGSVATRQNLRIAFIDQKITFDENLTVEEILRQNLPLEYDLDRQRAKIESDIQNLTALIDTNPNSHENTKRLVTINHLHLKLSEITGVPTNNIIQSALKLGFLNDLSTRKFCDLSGGQQKRVQIIASLLTNPHLILLDEPTNHLDIQTVEWLEEFLLKIAEEGFSSFGLNSTQEEQEPVAFIIISHDRALLDTLVNKILEIEHGEVKKYDGNYEEYNEQKINYIVTEEKIRLKMANTMRRELEWLRDGVRARTTKQTARIKRAHDLDKKLQHKNQKMQLNRQSDINFHALMNHEQRNSDDDMITKAANLGQQELMNFERVSILHPAAQSENKFIFKDVSFILKPGTRIALLGPNGCGKSTLLKYIAQKIPPFTGRIKYHELCSISYFDQKRELLDYTDTVKNNIVPSGDHVFFKGKFIHFMSYLDRFLFTKENINKYVSELSGGEQARLLLAKLMLDQANCLILDEPTNDLDIQTLQVLERNLADFDGGVIFTSHDRYFMQKVATNLLTFVGEKNQIPNWTFFSDLNQALEHLEKFEADKKEEYKSKNKAESKKELDKEIVNTKSSSKSTAKNPKNPWKIAQLEKNIEEIENTLSQLNTELENMYSDQKSYKDTLPIVQKIQSLQSARDKAYSELEKML